MNMRTRETLSALTNDNLNLEVAKSIFNAVQDEEGNWDYGDGIKSRRLRNFITVFGREMLKGHMGTDLPLDAREAAIEAILMRERGEP